MRRSRRTRFSLTPELAVQQSITILFLASAILAAPLGGQSPPSSDTARANSAADSLGPDKPAKAATSKAATSKAAPAKAAKPKANTSAKDATAKSAAKPARKTWSSGKNGYHVDSAEAATLWPVKGPAALPGAILPAKRIIAYYGNPLSKRMGILGEIPPDQMLARLDREEARWEKADPGTPVQPALHLIAVVAQGSAGRDGMWRTRMSDSLIEQIGRAS